MDRSISHRVNARTMSQTTQAKGQADGGGIQDIPKPALVLGFAGLIPFVALTAIMLLGPADLVSGARPVLLGYTIAILSFMGGIHWGLAITDTADTSGSEAWRRYGVSVLPALGAAATMLLAPQLQFFWLTACFAALLAYDVKASVRGETAAWYPGLRWPLTVVVCLCLGAVSLLQN